MSVRSTAKALCESVARKPHPSARHSANGTWLEPEELTYPSGGMHRRCRAIGPDGKAVIVKAGIADTYFSVPARHPVHGKGFLTHDEEGYKFTPSKKNEEINRKEQEDLDDEDTAKAFAPGKRHIVWHQEGWKWGGEHQDYPDEVEDEKDTGHLPSEPGEEGETAVDQAVSHLKDAGVRHASASHHHTGMWYETEPEQDFHSGVWTRRSYHLKNFSPDEEKQIAQRMTHTGVRVQ